MKKTVFLLLALGFSMQFYGQQKNAVQDSTKIYKKIEDYSKKSKFTKMLHKWLFRPTDNKPTRSYDRRPKPNYHRFSGKIVRTITIDTKDPFGFSFSDTTKTPHSWLEKTGNTIHIKSKEMAIRNFLLVKENKPLDTFLIAESARLLRAQNYIRDVRIVPKSVPNAKDSVDIVITALDSWSLIPKGTFSGSQTKLSLKERNFIGIGHEVELGFEKRLSDGENGFKAIYSVPNFKNTFVGATGRYTIDYDGYYDKAIAVDRQFYSPLTRWAGGIFLQERYLGRLLPNDTAFVNQDFKFLDQDYWAGHSFRIFKGSTEKERTTNFIVSVRTLLVNYKETPSIEYDSIQFFANEQLYLGSIGINSRQFVEDSYIFKDGRTEDVPIGTLYSLTGGLQHKNNKSRYYLGGQISYGNYFKWGFVSTNFEAGSFFNGSKPEQTAFSFTATYFSHLLPVGGKWKMRQFVKPQFLIGSNRLNSVADRLSLNENPYFNGADGNMYFNQKNGNIPGFDSPAMGTSKYVLALQTQFYSPWEVLGFHLNPYLNVTLGMLTDKKKSYGSNKLYSSFGVGCIIRNDYLVFDSFQFSLAFFPSIPGQGMNILQTNGFENDDFGFQNFQIGKPHPIIYQ